MIIKCVKEKNIVASLIYVYFSNAFDSIHREKMEKLLNHTVFQQDNQRKYYTI